MTTLKNLIDKLEFYFVEQIIRQFYRPTEKQIIMLKLLFERLQKVEITSEPKIEITIDHIEFETSFLGNYITAEPINGQLARQDKWRMLFSLHWQEWLSAKINPKTLRYFMPRDIVAFCMAEMFNNKIKAGLIYSQENYPPPQDPVACFMKKMTKLSSQAEHDQFPFN